MNTLLSFLLTIAVLVVFHELGHYWVARWCGVKVLRFSVGFGKVIYSKRFAHSDTEWTLSALPLGGYVKMLDEREGNVAEYELPRAFNRQSVFKRMAIVVAGPVANLLLAIVLYWAMFLHGVPGLKPMLGTIPPQTPAASAGLLERETLSSINGEAVPTWQEARWMLLDAALKDAPIEIEALTAEGMTLRHRLDASSLKPADLDGDFLKNLGLQPWQPTIYPVFGKLADNSVAQRAGLQTGDQVLRASGKEVKLWEELVTIIRSHPGQPLALELLRAGSPLTITLTPESVNEAGLTVGKIGAAPQVDRKLFEAMLTEVRYNAVEALPQAIRKTWETAVVSLKMMGKMLAGEVSMKNLSGPLTIADYAGQSTQMGLIAYLGFLALISISLGILNLMPVPLLDGGHLLYYTVELIKGSPVSERTWEIGQKVGTALLVTMMAMALYNDISRLILG
ncbi:Regulator of sigma-E protease RseP [Ferriphaselus amnicola]|uniref:Zinc metalloprotease n=1 Tax=Ferriphaselus amnicola TaxID=1188319 RepID=A0A2Z6G902_9PROT|nr:RIP metalloprotease RseP [Ferriphaselus amnicola]BBE49928.1 Regulator of sigma-E protease RseP [Ferriphaselus amnicola]